MGLEGVELIMATEETFGIEFSEDAYKLDTPEKVIDYIYDQIGQDKSDVCTSQQAFYLLRRTIQSIFHLDRKMITLETPIWNFIPNSQDGKSWFELQAALGARTWPRLQRSVKLRLTLVLSVLALPSLCFLYCYPKIGLETASVMGIIIMIIVGIVLNMITIPFRNTIPCYHFCVKDLIQYAQTSDRISWTREKISCIFRQLVIKQLGIDESIYREDAKFIDDFGMNG